MQELNYQSSLGRLPKQHCGDYRCRCSLLYPRSLPTLVVLPRMARPARTGPEPALRATGRTVYHRPKNTPSLAAQPDHFLQWQLVFFRSGAQERDHGADRRAALQ
jgi:hypothetical protein